MIMQMLLAGGGRSVLGGGVLTTYASPQKVEGAVTPFVCSSNATTQQNTNPMPSSYSSGYGFVIQDSVVGIWNFTPATFPAGAICSVTVSTNNVPPYASFNISNGTYVNAQSGAISTNLSGVVSSPLPPGVVLSGFWAGLIFFR